MKLRVIAAVTAALAVVLSPVGMAQATPPRSGPTTLAEGLVSPLHISVGPGKVVTVSESFASRMTNVSRSGAATLLYAAPGWDVAGSEYRGSTLFFVQSQGAGPDPTPLAGSLLAMDAKGTVTTITDQLAEYEIAVNPDGNIRYGLSAADVAGHPECVAQLASLGIPSSYTGEVDSHAYGLTVQGNTAYIADAGANAVFSVNLRTGEISTVALLPARPVQITADQAAALEIPACAGVTYTFESVPTDIEVGPDGWLYVASLPGGPEDDSLGARGAVFRVNPTTGQTQVYVEGLLSPTGIALDGDGNLYIASLFGAGVYKVPAGSHEATLFLEVEKAAAVEVSGSTLYVTTHALGEDGGKLISKRL